MTMRVTEAFPLKLGVVILAAGFSARMGQPKMLLPWGKTSIIGHLIGQWRALRGEQIGVVCTPDQQPLHAELDRLGHPETLRILNSRPEEGMFQSILCATAWAGWNEALTHWAIALGDQPHLRLETLSALLACVQEDSARIWQPTYSGRPRHPVILPRVAFEELKDSTANHLKEFLHAKANQVCLCHANDPGLDVDLDEPSDYERALRLAAGP